MNRIFSLIMILLASVVSASAQNAEMADGMRSEGKIYVVIAVIAVIFVCLLFFLVYLERRISKLEKRSGRERKQEL